MTLMTPRRLRHFVRVVLVNISATKTRHSERKFEAKNVIVITRCCLRYSMDEFRLAQSAEIEASIKNTLISFHGTSVVFEKLHTMT